MKLNKEYKQLRVNSFTGTRKRPDGMYEQYMDYDALKGKVVDKVAFTDRGCSDENLFIITFTDKTFIAVGTHYRDIDDHDDEPQLENYCVMDPNCVNGGNYECHCWVGSDGKVIFDEWITILKDLGIWEMEDDEVIKIIEEDKKKEEEREYQQYLRLKEKFEKTN